MERSTVNKHIKKGLAGKSPQKKGRKPIFDLTATKAIIDYAADCMNDNEPLGVNELLGSIDLLVKGTTTEDKFKHGKPSRGFVQAFKRKWKDNLWTEHPQNMSDLRLKWTTYANLDHGFDIFRDLTCQLGISKKNPAWDKASEDDKTTGRVEELLVQRPDMIGVFDEMPFGIVMNDGHKCNSDKKIGAAKMDITFANLGDRNAEVICGKHFLDEKAAATLTSGLHKSKVPKLRGSQKGRVRQRTLKRIKLGTFVGGV